MKSRVPDISDQVDRTFDATRRAVKRKARPAEKYMAIGLLVLLVLRLAGLDDEDGAHAR